MPVVMSSLATGGKKCVVLQVALQVVAEVLGQPGLAPCAIVAHGPKPGAQVCVGHQQDKQQQGIVAQAVLHLHEQLIVHCPGYMQQG